MSRYGYGPADGTADTLSVFPEVCSCCGRDCACTQQHSAHHTIHWHADSEPLRVRPQRKRRPRRWLKNPRRK